MKSNVAVVGAGHAKRWVGDLLDWDGGSETCAACCQVLPVRGIHVVWVDHAFTPVVVATGAACPNGETVCLQERNQL